MASLLVIEVSPRFQHSASRKLTATFVQKWRNEHAGGTVVVRDLVKTHLPFIDQNWIGGVFTPPEQHTPEITASLQISDELIAELQAADHILIGTPMYNFSIPANLKAYIDHIVRLGLTFTMSFEGLLTGKKATVILVSGSDYTPGTKFDAYDTASPYLRQILSLIGIADVNIILAGRALSVDQGEQTMAEFTGKFEEVLSLAAAG